MPAVLVEAGFIDNPEDNARFDREFEAVAQAIADGILNTLREEGEARSYYMVQTGVYRARSLAEQQLDELEARGFPAYLIYDDGYYKVMAGAFEECGRWLALKLTLRWSRGPEDALMYGAGHGGIEAVLVAGMTMLNNIIISLALNQGGLAAVEAFMGPIPETGMAAIQGMAAAPAGLYFWTAFERLSAVGLHIALSVLVYTAVRKRGKWYWFPAAILIHTLVDMTAVLTNALFPVAVTEGTIALLVLGVIFLARKIYLDEKQKTP